MAKPADYYDLLGVSRTASTDEIRSAYRKLARKYHPDVNKSPDAAKRFGEVQEAYDVLSDPEKRKSYDRFGHAGVGAGPPPGGAGWGGFGGPGRGPRTTWRAESGGMGAEDLSGIFEEIFGARARAGATGSPFDVGQHARTASPQTQRGRDIEHTLHTSFMTAALGGTEQMRMTSEGGTSTVSVKIPPGIDSGAKLRLKGKGQVGHFGGPAGDLILNIEVGKHPRFRREGLDVLVDVPINIAEAVQGTTIQAPLLSGETVRIKVPPGAGSGRKLRVREKGIRDVSGRIGDFYAIIQVVAPAAGELSEKGLRLVSELATELKNPRESAPYADVSGQRSAS